MATQDELKQPWGGGSPGVHSSAEFTYDFAKLGGATADSFELGELSAKMVVTKSIVFVETACTSGGSAVVTIGYDNSGGETADPDAFLDATAGAVANLVDDDLTVDQAAGVNLALNSGTKITMAIATAALLTGRIRVILEGYRVS